MKCPACQGELKATTYQGLAVEECAQCEGMWLTPEELDELENTVFDIEDGKGTMIFETTPSEKKCPVCAESMKTFNYRFYDLELDYCESKHGFWLDKGEEQRILELMKQEADNKERASKVEEQWTKTLRMLKSNSWSAKLFDLFHGS